METWLQFSTHALIRMAQRGISSQEIEYVCEHGRRFHRGGSVHYFLGKKDIPREDQQIADIRKLEGTTVLLDRETQRVVLTVYRNKHAPKKIRRKEKYQLNKLLNW